MKFLMHKKIICTEPKAVLYCASVIIYICLSNRKENTVYASYLLGVNGISISIAVLKCPVGNVEY
jgi:hypothetical protein